MYYLCSENKGADQLRAYREADLRLCFHICKKSVFSRHGSYGLASMMLFYILTRLPKAHVIYEIEEATLASGQVLLLFFRGFPHPPVSPHL